MPPTLRVAAAIIHNADNKFLIARKKEGKPLAGCWEFPGGKVEIGESDLSALRREIREELSVELKEIQFIFEYTYIIADRRIDFAYFYARIDHGEIQLTDHDDIAWINREEIEKYEIAPADREAFQHFSKTKKPKD